MSPKPHLLHIFPVLLDQVQSGAVSLVYECACLHVNQFRRGLAVWLLQHLLPTLPRKVKGHLPHLAVHAKLDDLQENTVS